MGQQARISVSRLRARPLFTRRRRTERQPKGSRCPSSLCGTGGSERRIVPAPAPDQPLANPLCRRFTRAFSRVLARCPPTPVMRVRFISSSTQEPRARLHGAVPMVAGAARKPRAELFTPPLRGSSRPLRCKKARPFGSLARLGPGRVQASPVPPITERHRNGAQPQRWREP